MTNNFRALCADLIEAVLSDDSHIDCTEIARRARAALAKADEPAVPEGREPAAVAGQLSDEEWDALVERVWDKYETVGYQGERFMYDGDFGSALDLVRKELFRWGHQPAPPADGEVAELTAWLRMQGEAQKPGPESLLCTKTKKEMHANGSRLIRAAELLQRQVLVPVSISERLPGPEDCDAEGRCWIWTKAGAIWRWQLVYLQFIDLRHGEQTHWLPAHALPLPEVDE